MNDETDPKEETPRGIEFLTSKGKANPGEIKFFFSMGDNTFMRGKLNDLVLQLGELIYRVADDHPHDLEDHMTGTFMLDRSYCGGDGCDLKANLVIKSSDLLKIVDGDGGPSSEP